MQARPAAGTRTIAQQTPRSLPPAPPPHLDDVRNPAVEQQAQDRIHRLGQFKPMRVTRFVIGSTIEERILKLQEKKQLVRRRRILGGGLVVWGGARAMLLAVGRAALRADMMGSLGTRRPCRCARPGVC